MITTSTNQLCNRDLLFRARRIEDICPLLSVHYQRYDFRFNKIVIEATTQVATNKEAVSLSIVYMSEHKCKEQVSIERTSVIYNTYSIINHGFP